MILNELYYYSFHLLSWLLPAVKCGLL